MFFRTMLLFLVSKRRSRLDIGAVARAPFRVLPTDLDILNHLNNGMYLSFMDLARMDLLIRAGAWQRFRQQGFYPVVVSETISFRKSLQPWQRFFIETRIAGYDAKAVYVEQRFVVNGEIFAHGFIRGRFLRKGGGTVDIAELTALLGVDVSGLSLPPWIERWGADVALPSTKAKAPSNWD